jgi:hypothetical protein
MPQREVCRFIQEKEVKMKTISLLSLVGILLVSGCSREAEKKEIARWDEVQFKICLRAEPYNYKPGDAIDDASGEFEDIVLLSLPIKLDRGPGKTRAVQDGVWIRLAWNDVQVKEGNSGNPPCLVFDGFQWMIENKICTPYGTSWQHVGLQGTSSARFTKEEWSLFATPVPLAPDGRPVDPRVICKMWRWVKNGPRPNIVLGEKRDSERTVITPD